MAEKGLLEGALGDPWLNPPLRPFIGEQFPDHPLITILIRIIILITIVIIT